MTFAALFNFLPELTLLSGALGLFFVSLGQSRAGLARAVALATALAAVLASFLCIGQQGTLFEGAYRVDLFSQSLKLAFAVGFGLVLLLSGDLADVRAEVKPEYYLFLTISVAGLVMLVSCVDLITIVISL